MSRMFWAVFSAVSSSMALKDEEVIEFRFEFKFRVVSRISQP
jgi:hypothetical protein